MKVKKKGITIMVSEKEKERVEEYCKENGRTITDLLREYIRGLN